MDEEKVYEEEKVEGEPEPTVNKKWLEEMENNLAFQIKERTDRIERTDKIAKTSRGTLDHGVTLVEASYHKLKSVAQEYNIFEGEVKSEEGENMFLLEDGTGIKKVNGKSDVRKVYAFSKKEVKKFLKNEDVFGKVGYQIGKKLGELGNDAGDKISEELDKIMKW